jgi:NTP pyrophosphatase (non-canonical NTP hydrolase)
MEKNGLAKLVEECGELIQVAAKKMAYMDTDLHPDGQSLKLRLQHEIADVMAACHFVQETFALDLGEIMERATAKHARFCAWHRDPYA